MEYDGGGTNGHNSMSYNSAPSYYHGGYNGLHAQPSFSNQMPEYAAASAAANGHIAPVRFTDLLTGIEASHSMQPQYGYGAWAQPYDDQNLYPSSFEYTVPHTPGQAERSVRLDHLHHLSWNDLYHAMPPSPSGSEEMRQQGYRSQQQQQEYLQHEGNSQQMQQQSQHQDRQVDYIVIPDSDDSEGEEDGDGAGSEAREAEVIDLPGPIDIGRQHDHEFTWPQQWQVYQKSVIYQVVRDLVAEGKEYKNSHNLYRQMRKKVNNGQAVKLYYGTPDEKREIASMFRRYKVQRPYWYLHTPRKTIETLMAIHRSIFHFGQEATRTWFYKWESEAEARQQLDFARLEQVRWQELVAQQRAEAARIGQNEE